MICASGWGRPPGCPTVPRTGRVSLKTGRDGLTVIGLHVDHMKAEMSWPPIATPWPMTADELTAVQEESNPQHRP